MGLAAESETAVGRVYNAGPGRHTSIYDLVQSYRRLTGRGPVIISVSAAAARRSSWLTRRLVKPFIPEAAAALSPAGLALMERQHRMDMSRAAAELNFQPVVTLDQGLKKTIGS
jgi:nucleoside-diphosphate-sugar epimerase